LKWHRTTKSFAAWLFCAFVLLLGSTCLYGQGGASTVTGVVRDSSGAIVPNANITLVDQATRERRISQSNNEGFFAFTAVRPSTYTVPIPASGFSEYQQKEIVVRPAEQAGLGDLALQIGSTSSRVEVTAQANLIPTNTAEKGTDITAQQIQNLAI
jgi:Carboxypeptidase regulatory-like domain